MRKFKLIKEYPGSPELGDIVETYKFGYTTRKSKHDFYLEKSVIEHSPDFWEELPINNYEILSFKFRGRDSVRLGDISVKNKEGNYIWEGDTTSGISCTLEEMLNSVKGGYNIIHSVKRLSDGVIFTIGDLIISNNLTIKIPCVIKSILISGESVHIAADTPIEDIEERQSLNYTGFGQDLETLELVKPLFITEDNEEIFIGDNYWVYDYGALLGKVYPVANASITHKGDGVHRKYFYSELNAKNYASIQYNNKKLSIKDLEKLGVDNEIIRQAGIFVNEKT